MYNSYAARTVSVQRNVLSQGRPAPRLSKPKELLLSRSIHSCFSPKVPITSHEAQINNYAEKIHHDPGQCTVDTISMSACQFAFSRCSCLAKRSELAIGCISEAGNFSDGNMKKTKRSSDTSLS